MTKQDKNLQILSAWALTWQMIDPAINYFDLPDWLWWTAVGTVLDWIINWFLFLLNSVITILDSIWHFFLAIFNWQLFSYLVDTFNTISFYLGTSYTVLFMALFGFVFIFMLFSFIIRLLRGRLSYSSSLSRIDYYKKHPEK